MYIYALHICQKTHMHYACAQLLLTHMHYYYSHTYALHICMLTTRIQIRCKVQIHICYKCANLYALHIFLNTHICATHMHAYYTHRYALKLMYVYYTNSGTMQSARKVMADTFSLHYSYAQILDDTYALHICMLTTRMQVRCKVLENVSPITWLKSIKNAAEIKGMREAHMRDGVAL